MNNNLSILLDYRYFIVICYKSFYNFTIKKMEMDDIKSILMGVYNEDF